MNSEKQILINLIKEKNCLYVTAKNKDYIRITQDLELLNENALYNKVIAFDNKSYFIRIFKSYFCLLFALLFHRFDLIYIGFPSQIFFPFLWMLNKKKKLIVDFSLSVYDTLIDDRKKIKENSFISKILHKIDCYVMRSADLSLTSTNADKRFFSEEFGVPFKKIAVLYTKTDTSIYSPIINENSVFDEDKLKVIYFGSMLPLHGFEVVLDAMELLYQEKEVLFTIIGPVKNTDKTKYPNTKFIDWLTQEELAKEIARSDLGLAGPFNSQIRKANANIVGKTYIIETMGKQLF